MGRLVPDSRARACISSNPPPTSDAIDLSILIVNWNSCDYLEKCLKSIFANLGRLRCEVIVIDNASYDGSDGMTRLKFPQVVFIQSDMNLGFSRANNLALSRSHGRNMLFLNPDTEINGSALEELVSRLESLPDAGIVGARLLNSDNSLQTTCITSIPSLLNQALDSDFLKRAFPRWRLWGKRPLFDGTSTPTSVEAISGACMLVTKAALEQVGGFTVDFFMYSEDMDLCAKIRRAGLRIYYIPSAVIVHHAGGSSASREESHFSSLLMRESVERFMELHHGRLYARLYKVSMALSACARLSLLAIMAPIVVWPPYRGFIWHGLGKWVTILGWSVGWNRWASVLGSSRRE